MEVGGGWGKGICHVCPKGSIRAMVGEGVGNKSEGRADLSRV